MDVRKLSIVVLFLAVFVTLPALAEPKTTPLAYDSLRARALNGCLNHPGGSLSNESPRPLDERSVVPDSWARLQADKLSRTKDDPAAALEGGRLIELPAGSSDALQAAINAAGEGGVVFVRNGAHTESGTVTVSHPVAIIGEPGARIVFDTFADPGDLVLDPALHVLGTHHVVIWGLELRPAAEAGGVAILLEDSPSCLIARNRIYDHQNSIFMHHADGTIIKDNFVVVTPLWQTGALLEADGILNVNGANVVMEGNEVSGGLFGVFISGSGGAFMGNYLHENLFGSILCKVPAGGFQLPGGTAIGSEVSATDWTATWNSATANFASGFLVIDGANNNVLKSNSGGGNGAYDVELVGESTRFGFCTPASFRNTVIAAPYDDIVIKDCGEHDKIKGGVQVDTSVDLCDAPCP